MSCPFAENERYAAALLIGVRFLVIITCFYFLFWRAMNAHACLSIRAYTMTVPLTKT